MKPNFRYIVATPIDSCDTDHIMNMVFNVRKDGRIQICIGDTIKSDEYSNPQNMTSSTYPNQAELQYNRQKLWLSMFTRHIEDSLLVKVEVEVEEK